MNVERCGGNYYWRVYCSKAEHLTSTEISKKSHVLHRMLYCSNKRCIGNMALSCAGSYTCSGTDESDCTAKTRMLVLCTILNKMSSWRLEFSDEVINLKIIFIKGAEFGAEVQENSFTALNKESSFIAHPEKCPYYSGYYRSLQRVGQLRNNTFMQWYNLILCNGVSGCHVKDSYPNKRNPDDTCADLTPYGQTEMSSKKFMFMGMPGRSWRCLNVNSDCKAPLQCVQTFRERKEMSLYR